MIYTYQYIFYARITHYLQTHHTYASECRYQRFCATQTVAGSAHWAFITTPLALPLRDLSALLCGAALAT